MPTFEPPLTTLDPDWRSGYKRANIQSFLAKCYVALSEIDWELTEWNRLLGHRSHPMTTPKEILDARAR